MVHKRIFVFHTVIILKHHKDKNYHILIPRKCNALNHVNIIGIINQKNLKKHAQLMLLVKVLEIQDM